MTQQKHTPDLSDRGVTSHVATGSNPSPTSSQQSKKASNDLQSANSAVPALIICRNKHWRYISSFHGPWLQLPPELLETIAINNYRTLRPHPIDPDVLFDAVRVRRLVDEATETSIRAANGTTLGTSRGLTNSSNGIFGSGAAALGMGLGQSISHAKLSRERRHRMRESATQKLYHAYQVDEILASVAMMQGASSLEEVAKLVLDKDEASCEARYVHFFHEKVPSRVVAACADHKILDGLIQDHPGRPTFLRTRATTRLLKNDFHGALADLTEALAACRHAKPQHLGPVQVSEGQEVYENDKRRPQSFPLDSLLDRIQPLRNLESQLLFHRGGVYLSLACDQMSAALSHGEQNPLHSSQPQQNDHRSADQRQHEARHAIKANAKRALRDYNTFLTRFEYSPGLTGDEMENLKRSFRSCTTQSDQCGSLSPTINGGNLLELPAPRKSTHPTPSETKHQIRSSHDSRELAPRGNGELVSSKVYKISELFTPSPPADLPPYPNSDMEIITQQRALDGGQEAQVRYQERGCLNNRESLTYHPFLTDALHSLLLCHSVMQTPAKEMLRHAHMAARLTRICNGHPVFLSARPASRVDWTQLIKRADNWLGLDHSWDQLCDPRFMSGQNASGRAVKAARKAQEGQRRRDAVMDALADKAVHDESSEAALNALGSGNGDTPTLSGSSQGGLERQRPSNNDEQHSAQVSTDRVNLIACWIRDVPLFALNTASSKRNAKMKAAKRKKSANLKMKTCHGAEAGSSAEVTDRSLKISNKCPPV